MSGGAGTASREMHPYNRNSFVPAEAMAIQRNITASEVIGRDLLSLPSNAPSYRL
jgi:hypothetical protein